MIRLTTIVGEAFILNAELIRSVERRGDTFITLTTGDRVIVSESMDEVMRRALRYQRAKYLLPSPATASAEINLLATTEAPHNS